MPRYPIAHSLGTPCRLYLLVIGCVAALVILSRQPNQADPTSAPTLTYFQEHFIIRDGPFNESAPLSLPEPEPKLAALFRRNATFAVWDERGITVRVGKKVKSTRLPDIPLSPKAFTRAEIRHTLALIKQGKRSREASGLSGAVRIGGRVYFLVRWDDNAGNPWTEALVQVDLEDKFPAPRFLLCPEVMSLGRNPVDTQLFILDGKISYISRKGSHWGIAQFEPDTDKVIFAPLGDRLISYLPVDSRSGLFVEATGYGTTLAGRIDLHSQRRRAFAENRSKMRFIDALDPPCLVMSQGDSAQILDTETGAILDMPVPSSVRRTSRGLIVWTPTVKPRQAWLYDPKRWDIQATWDNRGTSPN